MRYPLTFYTDRFMPDWMAGCMVLLIVPVILIRPKYREDEGLYRHELAHVKQAARLWYLHALLYWLHRGFRLRAEVEAYREQMRWPDRNGAYLSLTDAALLLADRYKLNITQDEAARYLA